MAENIPLRVQFKRMSADEWARSDVILLESEIGFETDTGFARAGDGHNRFSDLGYISPLDYNLLTNKPNIDGLATKVETAQKLQQKADKETVYTKAESKQELDKKLNLKGGVMTGQRVERSILTCRLAEVLVLLSILTMIQVMGR